MNELKRKSYIYRMSEELKECPVCKSPYGYSTGEDVYACPECSNEWNTAANTEEENTSSEIVDSNGNPLQDGDTVIVIKQLPVKGSSSPIKAGTKVKNIKLVDGDHDIACKIDGFGSMGLKSEFVRKA